MAEKPVAQGKKAIIRLTPLMERLQESNQILPGKSMSCTVICLLYPPHKKINILGRFEPIFGNKPNRLSGMRRNKPEYSIMTLTI
jgi:hypothetical protein